MIEESCSFPLATYLVPVDLRDIPIAFFSSGICMLQTLARQSWLRMTIAYGGNWIPPTTAG